MLVDCHLSLISLCHLLQLPCTQVPSPSWQNAKSTCQHKHNAFKNTLATARSNYRDVQSLTATWSLHAKHGKRTVAPSCDCAIAIPPLASNLLYSATHFVPNLFNWKEIRRIIAVHSSHSKNESIKKMNNRILTMSSIWSLLLQKLDRNS